MQGPFLRKYGVETTINFDLYEVDGVDLRIDAVHAAGDTKIMKNEGAEANTDNGFTDEGSTYSIVLTATEMEAARIKIILIDSATKIWLDDTIVVETYGNASAMHAFDLGTASTAQTGDNYARLGAAGAGLTALPWNAAWDAEAQSEVADALAAFFTSAAQLVDDVWDEVLTGATHNVNNSAGKRLRGIDAAFEVGSGTAQSGTSTTITLAADESAIDNIYNGDRIVIVGGTGQGEHSIVTDYNGTTKVATMSKAWVVTPDATSEYEVVPADTDVETWNNVAVTSDGDWSELQTDVDAILVDTNELQTDWANGGRLDLLVDAILADSGELQTDWTNGGRLDLLIDAIKERTDNLPDDPADDSDIDTQLAAIAVYLDTEIAAILADTNELQTDDIPGLIAALNDLSAANVGDAVHDEVVEGSTTLRQLLRGFTALLLNKSQGGGTTTPDFRDIADTKNRVTFTTDTDGNRTAVTLDLT